MNIALCRFAIQVALAAACCAACGSGPDEHSTLRATVAMNPLLGTWRWTGQSPGPTALSVTFDAGNTLAFVEQVQPASLPAGTSALPPPGFDPDSCVPILFCNGTYEVKGSQRVHVLSWKFTDGTKGTISGCGDPSDNSPGVPLTDDEVSSFIDQGHLPPRSLTYDVSASELLLTSGLTKNAGVASGDGTTFTKFP